jgi:hypothetical protein
MKSLSPILLLVTGCISTEASRISVRLENTAQDVRDLPVIASGKTSLLGQDVPDSHGEITLVARVEGADHVLLSSLDFTVDIGGEALDLEIERTRIAGADAQTGLVSSTISDGDSIVIDFRAKQLAELVLPQGTPYLAHTTLAWQEDDIGAVESDTVALDTASQIAAAFDTGSFELRTDRPHEARAPETGATNAEIRGSVEVTSGLTVDLRATRIRTTYFGVSTLPTLGLALVDSPAAQIAGASATQVAPTQVLDIYTSSNPTATPAPYAPAGTAAVTGDVSGGKALVTMEIDYEPSDGTGSVTTDVVAFVADVP